jgi:hypothetical protein
MHLTSLFYNPGKQLSESLRKLEVRNESAASGCALLRWSCGTSLLLALTALWLSGCQRKEVQALLEPSQAVASVLVDEAIHLMGGNKQVVLITHDSTWGLPSTAEETFQAAMKKQGVTLQTVRANLGNPMLSGEIGLKAAHFFEALDKSAGSGAIISLVGAPLLTDSDISRVKSGLVPVLVVATASLGDKMGVRTDPVQLARLLDARVIQLAIIDGAERSGAAGKSDPKRELFAQHYRILRRPD